MINFIITIKIGKELKTMSRQEKIAQISTRAIRDMRGKSLVEMYQLIKPETNGVNRFYNSIIHSVISAIQKTLTTEVLTLRHGGIY
jgi:hypothetical protein